MSSIDERIVQMQFNNSQFEKGIKSSLKSLDDLKKGLDLEGSAKQLKALQKAGDSFSLAKMAEGIEAVSKRFSTLGIIGQRVLGNIADTAYYKGKRLLSSLSVDQISAGWVKYGQKTASVQTIINATGKSIEEVNGYLEKLMWFSDETSYGFTDMTQALGQLSSAGGDVEKLIPMIEGIANATAYAGKGTAEFSRAIYNLNQSYGAGYLQYMDWRSLELAGVASKQLKQELIDAGKAAGTLTKEGKAAGGELVTIENFAQTLNKKWATTEVMESAFGKFAEMTEKAYQLVQSGKFHTASEAYEYLASQYDGISITAAKAAQEAKTFTEAIDATKDAVSSGWMKTFELIFGNYDEAKVLWTDLANALWEVFASGAEHRNELLAEWKELGGRDDLIRGITDSLVGLHNVLSAVKDAFLELFPPITVDTLLNFSKGVKKFGAAFREFTEPHVFEFQVQKPGQEKINVIDGFLPGGTSTIEKVIKKFDKPTRNLSLGSTGKDVEELQKNLKALGYEVGEIDGIFGSKTLNALKSFQKQYNLTVDGVYGSDSNAKMEEQINGVASSIENLSRVLRRGGTGDDVKKLQTRLKELGFEVGEIDGIFGPKTQKALEEFQKKYGLVVDGIYGEKSHAKMGELLYSTTNDSKKRLAPLIAGATIVQTLYGDIIEKLRRIARGIAAAFLILYKVHKFIFGIVRRIAFALLPLANAVLSVAAAFGDWLVALNSSISSSRVFEKAMQKVQSWIQPVADWIKIASDNLLAFFGINGETNAARANLYKFFGLGSIAEGSAEGIKTFTEIFEELKMKVLTTGVIPKIEEAFTRFKKAISSIGPAIKYFGTKIKNYFGEKVTTTFKRFVERVPKAIASVIDIFAKAIDFAAQYIEKIPGYWNRIEKFFTDIFDNVKNSKFLKKYGEYFREFFEDIWEGIKLWVNEGKIPEFVQDIGQFFTDLYNRLMENEKLRLAYEKTKTVLEDIAEWLKTAWANIRSAFSEFFAMNVDDNAPIEDQIKESFSAFNDFGDWLKGTWKQISDKFEEIVSNLKANFERLKDLNWGAIGNWGIVAGIIGTIVVIFKQISAVIHDVADIRTGGESANNTVPFAETFRSIAISTAIIAGSIIAIGMMDPKAVDKGLATMGIVFGAISAIIALSAIFLKGDAGNAVQKVSTTFKNIGKGIASISASIIGLGLFYSLNKKAFVAGSVAVSAIAVVLSAIVIAMSKITGKAGRSIQIHTAMSGMIKLAIAIGVIALVIAGLGKMNTTNLIKGLAAMAVIAFGLKKLVEQMPDNGTLKMAGFFGLATAVAVLAVVAKEIGSLNTSVLLKGVGSMAVIMAALAMFMKVVSDVSTDPKALAVAAGMLILVAGFMFAFVAALKMLPGVYAEKIAAFAQGLSAILIGISGALALMNKFGSGSIKSDVKSAASMALSVGVVAGIFAVMLAGVGELNRLTKGKAVDSINRGAEVLKAISDAIDGMGTTMLVVVGAIGVFSNALSLFATKGNLLSSLGYSALITVSFGLVATLIGGIIGGIGLVDEALEGKSVEYIENGAKTLNAIGKALESFSEPLGVATLAIDTIGQALSVADGKFGGATKMLLKGWLNSLIITGTLASIPVIIGAILTGIGSHAIYSEGAGSSDVDKINKAGEVLEAVSNALDSFAGPLGVATLAIAAVGGALGALGLKGVGVVLTGSAISVIISGILAVIAGIGIGCLEGLGKWDEASGGDLIDDIQRAGEVLGSVGGALSQFVSGWKKEGANSIADSIKILSESNISEDDTANALAAANAVNDFISQFSGLSFGAMLKSTFLNGFVSSPFFDFTSKMRNLATTINDWGSALSIVDDTTISNTQTALDAARLIGDFFTEITSDKYNIEKNKGLWDSFWFGDTETGSFITNMEKLSGNIQTLKEASAGLSESTFSADAKAVTDFVRDLAGIAIFSDDVRYDPGVLGSVAYSLISLQTNVEKLSKSFKEAGGIDLTAFDSFSNSIQKVASSILTFYSLDTSVLEDKLDSLKALFSGISLEMTPITNACQDAVSAIREFNVKFKSAGSYLAAGLVQGIKSGIASVRVAGSRLAKAAYDSTRIGLEVASPSKKGIELGKFFDLGVAKGMSTYTHAVATAGEGISQSAIMSVQKSLSSMNEVLSSGTSSDPIIRPVVDLTNVSEGANAIRGMLSGGSTISVGANLSGAAAVSASIKAARENQNGSGGGNIDNSKVNTNSVNLSGNNFYVRSEKDIHSLASEIASLTYQQQRGLGYT